MYKIFDTLAEYNQFTDNGTHLTAGILYLVKENKSLYFLTNNIDGEAEKYEYLDEIPEGYIIPTGNIAITENGENIDVNNYATATVNVTPNLTTQNITENGTYQPSGNYDGFSSVTVNVPHPTGNIEITENGEDIDIAQYATATVNVAGSGGNEDLIDLIERDFTTFNIPNGTTKIGDCLFYSNLKLRSVTIPSSVTSIGSQAFDGCMFLNSIIIPSSVTSIGSYAFKGCSRLGSVIIPSSVTGIGENAFQGCTLLESVTINATTPPTLGSSAFINANNVVIYVPAASVEAYKAATNWKTYASRIQPIPTE